MKRRVFLGLAAAGVLAGCGGGRRRRRAEAEAADANPLIPKEDTETGLFQSIQQRMRDRPYTGTPVATITSAVIEPASGGVLLRVEGLTLRPDAHDVRLIPDSETGEPVNGVISYTLSAEQPETAAPDASATRAVLAAVFISRRKLAGAREIRVRGARNERVIRL